MRFSPYFLYFLKVGHPWISWCPLLLTIIIISEFFEKSIPFSKFFLKIFFRRISSNYFSEKKRENFFSLSFYLKTSSGISSSSPKARASAIASPTSSMNSSFGPHWATPISPSGRITVVMPAKLSRPIL